MHYSCGTNQTLSSPNHQFTNHFCNNYILKEAKRRRQNESSKRGNSTLSLKQVPPSTKVTAVVTAELNAPCELGGCSWGQCTNPAGDFRLSVSWRTGQGQRRSNSFQSRRTVTSSNSTTSRLSKSNLLICQWKFIYSLYLAKIDLGWQNLSGVGSRSSVGSERTRVRRLFHLRPPS